MSDQHAICCPTCRWKSPFTSPTWVEAVTEGPAWGTVPIEATVRRTLRCERPGCERTWNADLIRAEVEATIRRSRCAALDEASQAGALGSGLAASFGDWPSRVDTCPAQAVAYGRARREGAPR